MDPVEYEGALSAIARDIFNMYYLVTKEDMEYDSENYLAFHIPNFIRGLAIETRNQIMNDESGDSAESVVNDKFRIAEDILIHFVLTKGQGKNLDKYLAYYYEQLEVTRTKNAWKYYI